MQIYLVLVVFSAVYFSTVTVAVQTSIIRKLLNRKREANDPDRELRRIYDSMSPKEKIAIAGDPPSFEGAKQWICVVPYEDNAVLARYKIISKLADGGFGEVYKVKDKCDNDKEWALKIFRIAENSGPGTLEHEIHILGRLGEHENIMSFERTISLEKESFALMKLMLGSLNPNTFGPMTISKMKQLMKQVIPAVSLAHSKGVILADIKLDNILIESLEPIKIRLTDLGLSNDNASPHSGGTEAYQPMEKLVGIQVGDHKSDDIWAVGALMCYLLVDENVRRDAIETLLSNGLSTTPQMTIAYSSTERFLNIVYKASFGYGDTSENLAAWIGEAIKAIVTDISQRKFYYGIIPMVAPIDNYLPDEFKNDVQFMDFFKVVSSLTHTNARL